MNKIWRYILFAVGFIIVTLLGLLFPDYWVAVPAFWPFGYGFLIILVIAELILDILQGKSPQVIAKTAGGKGYWSVNRKDIISLPWYKNNGPGSKEKIGEMTIMFVGGIDYGGINPKSNSDYPVLIFPSIYSKKVGLSYEVDCNMVRFEFNQLPPFLRHFLKYKYSKRIKDTTAIYFGATSTRDGTATPFNDNLLEQMRVENEYVNKIEEINQDLYKELKKADERKAKQYFIKEAGVIDET